ncbi:MAG TPA: polyprenyl diphosphate synthase [Candidatus Peribacteraceae bacterium]|nr:polyprenyl diphosphate synthase [Candidatus Peribacteraceae bacterium]
MTPLHLAIIPDGNRRWARAQGLFPWKGHEKAVENFRTITDWARENPKIGVLTVWCFSTENWKRDTKEVNALMKMLEDFLRREQELFLKNDTRFVHSGRKDRIPTSLAALIAETEEKTKDCISFTLHLAVDYGGKDEIVRAVRKLNPTEITEESLRAHTDHPELPDIDLIFRTSGEMRFSNFFLWQGAYAEWIFTDKYFPDVTTKDLAEAIQTFEERQRRYGA